MTIVTLMSVQASILLFMASAVPYATAQSTSDIGILNFALNLEYLEAEFYSWAAFGIGLPSSLRGGGPASIGGKKAMLSPEVQAYAEEIAKDEIRHVMLLRNVLGANAVPMPLIDVGPAFAAAAQAAFNGTDLMPDFDPYASDVTFLHGAFLFEDVGVTAYHGAAPLINNSAVLSAAAGLLGTEAYHAGAIRALAAKIAGQTVFPYGATVAEIFEAISDLRNALGGAGLDQGLLYNEANNGYPMNTEYNITTPFNTTTTVQDPNAYYRYINLVPTDANSLPFARTPEQVLAIVYGGTQCGLFFPRCINTQAMMAPAAAPTTSMAG